MITVAAIIWGRRLGGLMEFDCSPGGGEPAGLALSSTLEFMFVEDAQQCYGELHPMHY
jgi:hypothetical protein